MSNHVKVQADGKLRCPRHGAIRAEYKPQDPAPCGCAWIWEDEYLVAVPSVADVDLSWVRQDA